MTGRMGFVGVDTAHSSIQRVFPLWADHLGLPSRELRGFDIALGADDATYREVLRRIRDDPDQAGALVTTHKIRLYEAAHDLFDELDDFARACGEISSVSKRAGRLLGHAKDPITVGLALEALVGVDYFKRSGAGVICLGAGGSGIALAWYLAHRADRPGRVVLAGLRTHSVDHARLVLRHSGAPEGVFDFHVLDPADPARAAGELVAAAPPGSLIVNATGMGKDRPGSPLPDDVVFPEAAVVWEFNYRGSLEFLGQARARAQERRLAVSDGWQYFIHGWSEVIAEVFDIPMPPTTVAELAAIAATVRDSQL